MADWSQFEGFEAGHEGRPAACSVCEAMLPDAVDGALTAAEQRAFDQHVAGCVHCARELEEAQRGAAWLSMLKSQAPEPPAYLLAKILAETTGVASAASRVVTAPAAPSWGVRLAAFGGRIADVFSIENSRMTFQPRLAMTAAMAFFSIALTLNMTGVRLQNLRASDFTPGGVRRSVMDASASAARSFQSMRVVYQVESRVSELRSDGLFGNQENERNGSLSAPDSAPANDDFKSRDNSAAPQDAKPADGGAGAQDGNQKPQDSKPKGSSELVMPFLGRNVQGYSVALRKDV